ncbi:cystatin [Paramormyrops kingsleyae]|uniref:cystatin n=1 Tax=Paramormyrops kingsleyae TaxID=1676925 RepID=UPI003B96FF57
MSCFLTQSTMGLLAILVLSLLSTKLLEANEEEILLRRTHHLGAPVSIPPQSPEVQASARLATEKFSSKSRSKMLFRLLDVTSAEMQVTNIITFKIWATIGKTKCPKSTDADLESCVLGKRRLSCTFEVTYDPRTNQHKVPISDCKKAPAAAR